MTAFKFQISEINMYILVLILVIREKPVSKLRNILLIFFRDCNRFGGGVVVYIREVHSFKERKDLNLENLEMICCEINKPQSRPTLISAWYRPPNSEMKIFDSFEIFLKKCDVESKELLIIGDINCNILK